VGRHLPAQHRSCGVVRHGYQTLPSPTSSVVPESAGQNIFSPHQRNCMGCLERQPVSCGFNNDLWLSTNARSPQLKLTIAAEQSLPGQPVRYFFCCFCHRTVLYNKYMKIMSLRLSPLAKLRKKSRLVIPLRFLSVV
jgi:hypothetical protein